MGCSFPFLLGVRISQLVFSLIVLGGAGEIARQFYDARQSADEINGFIQDTGKQVPPYVFRAEKLMTTTPRRIYLAIFVSVWTLLVALYIMLTTRYAKGRFAPYAAVMTFEIVTIVFWFCAFVSLATFAAEVEVICLGADSLPELLKFLKGLVEGCVLSKVTAAFAALSWLFWVITCITLSVQRCRSKRKARKAVALEVAAGGERRPYETEIIKEEQVKGVTTLEMTPV